MTQNWFKYTYACSICDALIEITNKTNIYRPHICCGIEATWLSVVNATIAPTTQTKEEKMEDTSYGATVTPVVPESYNSNLLVTYKVIRGLSDAEYATDKVTTIEWDLHNGRQSQTTVQNLRSKIDTVKDIICEAYTDSGDQETLRAIAEALDIELIKEVQFTASIEISGTYSYDVLSDYSEYDLESVITDSLFADSNDGSVQVDDTEVCNVREA
jgi:hypothetical protein